MSFSLEQILQLFAIACDKPEEYKRPISHWTPRELADQMVKQGIVSDCTHAFGDQKMAEGRTVKQFCFFARGNFRPN